MAPPPRAAGESARGAGALGPAGYIAAVGLSLEIESREALSLDTVRRALEAEGPEPRLVVHEADGILAVEVHPAAEPLHLSARDGKVALSAKTGTAGAGLHDWVCGLVDRLAERTGVPFDVASAHDPSGYVRSRDLATLLRYQHAFLAEVASQVLELARTGHSKIALGLPDDVTFEGPEGIVATPLGPRGEAWLGRVKKDGAAGEDALPWARPGRDAAYFRGLALTLAWMEVRYRAPLDDEERALLERVLAAFEASHALAPEAPQDWSLWSELYELTGEESLRATRTHLKAEKSRLRSEVGYRRFPVTVQIGGGFRLRVPGELKCQWERDGRVWVAWDATRSLHVSTVRATGRPAAGITSTESTLAALLRHEPDAEGAIEHLSLQRGAIRGQAAIRTVDDEGQPRTEVRTVSAMGPHGALGTFLLARPEDRPWALELWGTLDHEEAQEHLPS